MVSENGVAGEVPQPPPVAGQPKKRSRWGSKEDPADGAAAAPGGDDGGEAKRQRKSKVSVCIFWRCVRASSEGPGAPFKSEKMVADLHPPAIRRAIESDRTTRNRICSCTDLPSAHAPCLCPFLRSVGRSGAGPASSRQRRRRESK